MQREEYPSSFNRAKQWITALYVRNLSAIRHRRIMTSRTHPPSHLPPSYGRAANSKAQLMFPPLPLDFANDSHRLDDSQI